MKHIMEILNDRNGSFSVVYPTELKRLVYFPEQKSGQFDGLDQHSLVHINISLRGLH